MTENPLLFIAEILTLVDGWTDSPKAIATCVVIRCMPPKLGTVIMKNT